ncbi:MAG: co-chaperone GroES [SAR202 cluster bacterium Io17-Chloro-G7]|nr:MAG: co-chaperone GroES [SAR202 cluster bacterium Io17-Chloro-G7]
MTTTAKTSTSIKPMSDRILIRPTEQEEITQSGIFLPDTARERPQEGEVLAVGPGRILSSGKRLEMELKAGDKVIYSKYAGTEIEADDGDLLLLGSNDILMKV